jgi:Metallo-peptidase family M12
MGRFGSFVVVSFCFALRTAVAQPVGLTESEREIVRERLRVSRFATERLTPDLSGGRLRAVVAFEDATFALDLPRRSVRGDEYRLLERKNGALIEVDAPAVATYRGEAFREGDSTRWRAAVTFRDGALHGYLHAESGEVRAIQPVADAIPGANRALHALFRDADVLAHDGVCRTLAATIGAAKQQKNSTNASPGWLPATAAASFKLAEVAFEGDVSYFNLVGGSGPAATDIDTLMNSIASIYEAEVGITYEVSTVVLQTDGSEQYASTDSEVLLEQYRSFWNSNLGGVTRDTSHLLTGKNLVGSTIGIAYVGVICNEPFGYGLSQTFFSMNLSDRVSLTAHEIGHNWNAGHCDSKNDCGVMCSFIGSCNGDYLLFGNSEENDIEDFRDEIGCLSNFTPAIDEAFLQSFEESSLDGDFWSTNKGASISSKAKGETSGKKAALIDFGDKVDQLISKAIDPTTLTDPEVSFFVAHRGVEAGESLVVAYQDAAGDWNDVTTITSDGESKSTFSQVRFTLSGGMLHDALKIRLKPDTNQSNDDWYVDDFELREFVTIPAAQLNAAAATSTTVCADADSGGPFEADFNVSNGGTGAATATWTATEVIDRSWLTLADATGSVTATNEIDVVNGTIDPTGVPTGTVETARVRITQTNGGPNDYYENTVTLVKVVGLCVAPGQEFSGTVDVVDDTDTCYVYALAGTELSFEALAIDGGLKPTIEIFDASNASIDILDFGKNDEGVTLSATIPETGIHRIVVSGRSSTTGTWTFALQRELAATAGVQTLKLTPTISGGDVATSFSAQQGSTLNLTATASDLGFGPFAVTIVDPDGVTLNATLFTTQLPDGGVLIRGLPLTVSGDYDVTVSGFTDIEELRLTLGPIPPALGVGTVTIG